ncbi:MAG: lysylphosphatidylglycerol synthase transmembrane domain-containing protein [Actinomycetota bacterium]|nr:lysylphosphatidylglycerol synthase transmembrane domain-containing protein [Actinomycetota bacterium]
MKNEGIRIPRWVSIVLVISTLGLVVWMIARDRPSLDALGDIEPIDLLLIMVLQVLYLIPESYRQKIVIESSSSTSIRPFQWFRIFVVGRFLNTLVPQSGNVYRALRLRNDLGIAISEFGGGMAAFVIMSVVASLFVAAPLLAWQSPSPTIGGVPVWIALLIAGTVLAATPFLIWFAVRDRSPVQREQSRIVDTAHRVVTATITALSDVRLMISFVAVWIMTLVVVVLLYTAVFDAIGWDLAIGEAIAIYALLQASSFIVLTPGNLGIQELGFAALAAVFGIPAAIGVIAAGLIRATGWIAVAVPAAVFGSDDIVRFFRSESSAK